jgi:uncharacterized protein YneF (UPF0154 family)
MTITLIFAALALCLIAVGVCVGLPCGLWLSRRLSGGDRR